MSGRQTWMTVGSLMFNCERSLEQNGKALRKYLTYITEEKQLLWNKQRSVQRQFQVSIYGHEMNHKCVYCLFPFRPGLRPQSFLNANITQMEQKVLRPTFSTRKYACSKGKRIQGIVHVIECFEEADDVKHHLSVGDTDTHRVMSTLPCEKFWS